MSHLLLTNIQLGTTDDEVRSLLKKYGIPPYDDIEQLPGDGSRPSVVLAFHEMDPETLHKYAERIHHMFWNSRELTAYVLTERFA